MTSRLTSENFMPWWFWEMASETLTVVKPRGVPPVSWMPRRQYSAWSWRPRLQGEVSFSVVTTPIIGRAIASSSSPMARM